MNWTMFFAYTMPQPVADPETARLRTRAALKIMETMNSVRSSSMLPSIERMVDNYNQRYGRYSDTVSLNGYIHTLSLELNLKSSIHDTRNN